MSDCGTRKSAATRVNPASAARNSSQFAALHGAPHLRRTEVTRRDGAGIELQTSIAQLCAIKHAPRDMTHILLLANKIACT